MVALKLKLPYLAIIKISRDRLLNEENVVRQVFGFGAAVGKCGAAKPVRTRHGGQANKLQLPSGWHKIQSTPKKRICGQKKIRDLKYNCWPSTLKSRLQLLKSSHSMGMISAIILKDVEFVFILCLILCLILKDVEFVFHASPLTGSVCPLCLQGAVKVLSSSPMLSSKHCHPLSNL